jgi:hypothetical protein
VHVIEYESLGSADLIVDAVYEGKDSRLASDPIVRFYPGCGNMGGFVSDDQHEKVDTNTHICLRSRALSKSATLRGKLFLCANA